VKGDESASLRVKGKRKVVKTEATPERESVWEILDRRREKSMLEKRNTRGTNLDLKGERNNRG